MKKRSKIKKIRKKEEKGIVENEKEWEEQNKGK